MGVVANPSFGVYIKWVNEPAASAGCRCGNQAGAPFGYVSAVWDNYSLGSFFTRATNIVKTGTTVKSFTLLGTWTDTFGNGTLKLDVNKTAKTAALTILNADGTPAKVRTISGSVVSLTEKDWVIPMSSVTGIISATSS